MKRKEFRERIFFAVYKYRYNSKYELLTADQFLCELENALKKYFEGKK